MLNRPLVTLVVLALLILCGCQQQVAYHQFAHIPSAGWDKTDTLHFDISPVATDGDYSLDAQLRTNKFYPFLQLTMEVNETVHPSQEHHHDVIVCQLIDKEGALEGDGISYFQYQFHVRDFTLRQGDSIHISLTHNMKRELMPGVTDVGLRLSLAH